MIFESHAHYDDERFDKDRADILGNIGSNGLDVVINVGASMSMNEATMNMIHQFPRVFGAIGMHPSELSSKRADTMEWLERNAKDEKVVAIGEIGLDYYWEDTNPSHEAQQEILARQYELARAAQKPVILHIRDA